MTPTHADFTIERSFGCTPAQTFSAFALPELRGAWFGPTADWTDASWKLDFRDGGGEHSCGVSPAGNRKAYVSRFHEIVADRRIVFAYDLLHDEALVSVSLVGIDLEPRDGGGTLLRYVEHGVYLVGGSEAAREREHGTGILLDRLAEVLP